MATLKIRTKRNLYVKGYKKFPYQKLTGKHYLYYTGTLIYYDDDIPDDFDSHDDFVFDCECEFEQWGKIIKVNN